MRALAPTGRWSPSVTRFLPGFALTLVGLLSASGVIGKVIAGLKGCLMQRATR
jgi:hypothetical protein